MRRMFRLKKDTADATAGTAFIGDGEDEGYKYADKFGRKDSWCYKNTVEGNDEWFEEIKEPERVEVFGPFYTGEKVDTDSKKWYNLYEFHTWAQVPKEKLSSIKQAIEEVLNGGGENVFDVEKLKKQYEWLTKLEDNITDYIANYREKYLSSRQLAKGIIEIIHTKNQNNNK